MHADIRHPRKLRRARRRPSFVAALACFAALGCSASSEAPASPRPAAASARVRSESASEARPKPVDAPLAAVADVAPPASSSAPEAAGVSVEPASSPLEPSVPPAPAAPRLTSQGYITFIWPRPARGRGAFLGYVRFGQSVAMKSRDLVRGEGCPGGYYAIEPRGYVCNDRTVTLAPDAIFADASSATAPAEGSFPYRYALSSGAPMYSRIPTRAEQARSERALGPAGKHPKLSRALAAHEDLAALEPVDATDPIPWFLSAEAPRPKPLALVRQTIPLGSMLSFTRVFEAEGRTFLLSADGSVVPADRTRVFRSSDFHGVRVGGEVRLPLAWMRREPRPRYRRVASGALEKLEATWPARSFVPLSGGVVEQEGARYLETSERDGATSEPLYVAEADATVARAEDKLPHGVGADQKWFLVRIGDGTLIAYEGLVPVYATLVSPGKGGVPVRGRDPVKDATTPLGVYYVTFKDRAATMSPEQGENRSFWIADVPHTQYFDPPFAIHAAYWHERFGEPTSAGCINLSPIDAEALFDWSDPEVPDGWQGATGAGATRDNGPTTAVVVRR